ncbi:hypothetical protein CAPTEDRAFT_225615 [Capitella teleta]|uniref:Uncharacterized protein n=1 Tax=Capitella teleta TaxID=283909 RepID=R7U3E1_CAPTE|nr:hypothetical protein CAPTEDRAFT_225615 [Capitella teleta]|eukprot:ELT97695.1 hypothetical protein CAPTEDRAFT_225615 [Capitella teleta]
MQAHSIQHGNGLPTKRQMEPVDISSRKKIFGWASIDGINIPYIVRNRTKYVSVRMVEMKLLSKYPCTYPEELKSRPPLTSQYVTLHEATLLGEINVHHCGLEYGHQAFSSQDLIVALNDFEDFYLIVKRNFPGSVGSEPPKLLGGWVQINNTIVPYVKRKGIKFVPLPVIKYGADLLNNVQVTGVDSSEREIDLLNRNCRMISLDFTFTRALTKLIEISLIPALSRERVSIKDLPDGDPFSHAKYLNDKDIERPAQAHNASQNAPTHKGRLVDTGPNATVSQPPDSASRQWMGPHMGIFHSPAMQPRFSAQQPISPATTIRAPTVTVPTASAIDLSAKAPPPSSAKMQVDQVPRKRVQDIPKTRLKSVSVKKTISLKDGGVSFLQSTTFHRKRITCIVKDGRGYALVESINRLFFPTCPLKTFIQGLSSLSLDINELTEEEEQAFIEHYELKIKKLRCSKIVNMDEIDLRMNNLRSLLEVEEESPHPPPQSADSAPIQQATCKAIKDFIGNKRPLPGDETPPPPKKKSLTSKFGKLENIMNKLKKAKMDDVIDGCSEESENNNVKDASSDYNKSSSDCGSDADVASLLNGMVDCVGDTLQDEDNRAMGADHPVVMGDAVTKDDPEVRGDHKEEIETGRGSNEIATECRVLSESTGINDEAMEEEQKGISGCLNIQDVDNSVPTIEDDPRDIVKSILLDIVSKCHGNESHTNGYTENKIDS